MNAKPLIAAVMVLGCMSCDQAKRLADKAGDSMRKQVAKATGGAAAGAAEDPQLAKLVDRNDDGYRFRKDLPFPSRLEVRTSVRREIDGRFYQTSAIDKRAEPLKGTRRETVKLERAGDVLRYTLEETGFTEPTVEKAEAAAQAKTAKDPLEKLAPTQKPRTFRRTGGSWRADDSDGFRAVALSRQLAPAFPALLEEHGLAPRPIWFGPRRLKPGDEVPLDGDALAMVLAGGAKGNLKLRFESAEAVNGHPCGVFTVSGDYSRKRVADFEGGLMDEEVAVQGGRVWLSLIHPVVMQWDLETIQTTHHGSQGNTALREQGRVKMRVSHSWKPL